MKKLDRKGFTLIELLAVITILGILMIVAIPAVSRTIENSRRNTFLSTAKQYANAVKTAFAADEIKCNKNIGTAAAPNQKTISATTLTNGQAFWVPINTDGSSATTKADPAAAAYDNAKELVNQGGVSSWGNANVRGWVIGVVSQATSTAGKRQEVVYYIELIDENGRGIALPTQGGVVQSTTSKTLKQSDELERADVEVSDIQDLRLKTVGIAPAPNQLANTNKAKITGATTASNNFLCYLG